jgi:hypothetical protein
MRTGNDEQSAAALPFRTQAGIDERMRTGDCYRSASNRQNECHDAERSRPSPDEIHEHSSRRFDVQSVVESVHLAGKLYMRSDNHRPKL